MARRSTCIHCSREIVKGIASEEYTNIFGDDDSVWFDKTENRALCMGDGYGTAHVTQREWNSGQ